LLINTKSWTAERRLPKLWIRPKLFLSESVKESNLPKWIADECIQLKIKTAPNISHLLAEYLGNDLSRIANELNKLKIILKEGEILDGTIIENHIGISKEYNIFELQKALGTKNANAALKLLILWVKIQRTILCDDAGQSV
jgi:DNA polymerase-3 subunit delta